MLNKLRLSSIDTIAIQFAALTDIYIVFLLALTLFILFKRRSIIQMLFASVLAVIISFIARFALSRPRPDELLGIDPLIFAEGSSFLTGPTLLVFALVPIFFFVFRKKGGIIWLILSALIAVSRLYFGIHFLSDILAAIVLGLIIGKLSRRVSEKLFVRRKSLS